MIPGWYKTLICAFGLLALCACSSGQQTERSPDGDSNRKQEMEKSDDGVAEDPVADAYLREQKNQNGLEDVPVRIDRTNDSDGEAFVVTQDTGDATGDESDGSKDTDPANKGDENTESATETDPETAALSEEERKRKEKEEQERKERLEKERKEREEARRKAEEEKRKQQELIRLKNEAAYHAEAFADRLREFEIAKKEFRIQTLVKKRNDSLTKVYPEARSFWSQESEERFSANPGFEVEPNTVYLVRLNDPLQYQSSLPVALPPGSRAIALKDPLAVWNALKGSPGRWILMEETKKGYVPLSLSKNGIQYRVASVSLESGIVKLEIYSRSSSRRAGQYHVLYPVELELISE